MEGLLDYRAAQVVELCLSDEAALRDSFFSDVELTEKNINQRFRLFSQFHPDRFPQSPNNDVFKKFFQILMEQKQIALERLERLVGSAEPECAADYHKKKAEEYLTIVVDWQNVGKDKLDRLRVLKREDYINKTPEEHLLIKKKYAELCYQQYRAACKIIDTLASQNSDLPKFNSYQHQQVELRKCISTALRAAEYPLESQLYAIGALRVLLECQDATDSQFMEIRDILAKVKSQNKGNTPPEPEVTSESENDPQIRPPIHCQTISVHRNSQSLAVGNAKLPAISTYAGRQRRQNIVRQDIAELVRNELAIPQTKLVSYSSPNEDITKARIDAISLRTKGALATATGGVVAVSSTGLACANIVAFAKTGAVLGSAFGPLGIAIGVLGGIFSGGIGMFMGHKIYRKGVELLREPKIRENLNNLIADAIKAYNCDEYEQFLEKLSQNYDERKETGNRLIHYDKGRLIKISPEKMIKDLLYHNFRPDGIAYLLVIIGETLMSGKVTLSEYPASTLEVEACKIFESVFKNSDQLRDAAEDLDNEVGKMLIIDLQILAKQVINCLFVISADGGSEEKLNDAKESPFVSRLQKIILVARLNFALVQVITGRDDHLNVAKKQLIEMYSVTSQNFQFFSITEYRLASVEDFLSALGFDPAAALKIKTTTQNLAPIAYKPTITINEIDGEKIIYSYVTDLGHTEDMLNMLNILSDGLFTLSRVDFLKKLQAESSPIAEEFLEKYEDELLDEGISKYSYLEIVSKLTKIQFQLYVIKIRNSESIFVKMLPEHQLPTLHVSKATICLGVESDYLENGVPKFVFLHNNNLTLKTLHNKLNSAKNNKIISAEILRQIGDHFMLEANKTDAASLVRRLIKYKEAKQYYTKSLSLFPTSVACWRIAECFLARNRNRAAIRFLSGRDRKSANLKLCAQPQFWYYCAKAQRGIQDYDKAATAINKALKLDCNNEIFMKERSRIQKCTKRSSNQQRQFQYDATQLDYNSTTYLQRQSSTSSSSYNILSIDGGGIRGIIPAVVLSEVERCTHRPISYNFNLISGTSTGGIISLGLTTPEAENSCKPKYRAADILSLYKDKSSEIFHKGAMPWLGFASHKYRDKRLKNVLSQYFNDTTLSQLLTDVAIPACNQNQLLVTTYFTRCEALKDPRKNFKILDVALATSAAPTYFPPHRIIIDQRHNTKTNSTQKLEHVFIDGGVHANNPAGYAYKHALDQGIKRENIYLWSLGTGDAVNSILRPQSNQGALFWAAKLHHVLEAQQNNVDDELHSIMGSHYSRHEVIEDLRADDNNSWNRLIEHLAN
ncbi:Patatin-like protein 2 [Trichoplax sp. H2]|nr:Patatin-like protein 2 [Trichoplax sp. H2]|eukprot:RDD38737.1 Patatin-like protein 2 [Trichoplax sp. H2]